MWLCKYDLSKECDGKYKDCVDCILDQIRAEIEHMIPCSKEALSMKLGVLEIIDKYKAESGGE